MFDCNPLEIDVDQLMESSTKEEPDKDVTVRKVGDNLIDISRLMGVSKSLNRPSWGGKLEADKLTVPDEGADTFRCGR